MPWITVWRLLVSCFRSFSRHASRPAAESARHVQHTGAAAYSWPQVRGAHPECDRQARLAGTAQHRGGHLQRAGRLLLPTARIPAQANTNSNSNSNNGSSSSSNRGANGGSPTSTGGASAVLEAARREAAAMLGLDEDPEVEDEVRDDAVGRRGPPGGHVLKA